MPPDSLLPDHLRAEPVAAPRSGTATVPARAGWRALLREPLLHFAVLGGLIFAADAWINPPDRTSHVIVVTQALRQFLSDSFDENKEHAPTPVEMQSLIDSWVASEILYREGKALGVDRGDENIRDRIAFKLNLLILNNIDQTLPTKADVVTWFEANHARFDQPERVSFYITPATTEARAKDQLARIEAGVEPEALAQTTNAMIGRPVASLDASFGPAFREALLAAPEGKWSVLRSTEGFHVVRFDQHVAGVPARLDDVYDDAVHTLQADETRRRAFEAVQKLKANYTVRYEDAP